MKSNYVAQFEVTNNNATVVNQVEDIDENTIEVDLTTKITKKEKLNLSYESIETAATILANRLLDYARNGGDMKNLTPSTIYSKKTKQ